MKWHFHRFMPSSSSYPSILVWLAAFHLELLQAILFIAV